MKRLRRLTLLLAGVLAAFLLAEGLLRLLPVDTGLRMMPVDGEQAFMRALPHQDYVYSHGWSLTNVRRGRTNNLGFLNSRDWRPGMPAVLVIGDSYIESSMNDYGETLQGHLESLLGVPVLSASNGGANAADYLRMLDFANKRLRLKALVVRVDSNDFFQSLPRYGAIEAGHGWFRINENEISLAAVPYRPSRLKETLRHVALARYVVRNLKFDPVASLQKELGRTGKALAEGAVSGQSTGELGEDVLQAIDYFLGETGARAQLPSERIFFVLDCDRRRIYREVLGAGAVGSYAASGFEHEQLIAHFRARAQAFGARVIDTCPVMQDYVRRTYQRLDYTPFDYHWNGVGHELVARAVAPHLMQLVGGGRLTALERPEDIGRH